MREDKNLEPGLGVLGFELHLEENDSVVRLEKLEGLDVGVDLALLASLFSVVRRGFTDSGEESDESTTGGLGGVLGGILSHDFLSFDGVSLCAMKSTRKRKNPGGVRSLKAIFRSLRSVGSGDCTRWRTATSNTREESGA